MEKIRVGVLRGGISPEYDVSLKTGDSVLRHLPDDKYLPVDLLMTKDGTWHANGLPIDPAKLSRRVDIVFNALHGEYGEDGKVQRLFENYGIPFTGSSSLPSSIGMNKVLSKDIFKRVGLRTPLHYSVSSKRLNEELEHEDTFQYLLFEILGAVPLPLIAKPVSGGSSVGTYIIKDEKELARALTELAGMGWDILFEEFINGREATCGVVDSFRGQDTYSLLPVEIRPATDKTFFDYDAKYNGGTQEICPGNFTRRESEVIQNMAKLAHKALRLRHYSRSDFIVTPKGIYILEVNTLPGLTGESLLPKSLRAVGASLPEFIDHIITLALR
ncbi:MAG: D-alanine--D-alanine ligase [Candidatus Parcubacteria bacterium]|nr:D-alanine--D-alanine ligase [Candidatus Parcubacteria bacterium]